MSDPQGQLAYGIYDYSDKQEFPWDGRGFYDWWDHDITGFPRSDFYDENGNLKKGEIREELPTWDASVRIEGWRVSPEIQAAITAYNKKKFQHQKQHPAPIELVNVCYADHPLYLLVVPGAFYCSPRICPVAIDPNSLEVDESKIKAFQDFVKKYVPSLKDEPLKWYLSCCLD